MADSARSAPASGPAQGHSSACGHCPGSHTGGLPCLATATEKARSWLLIEHPGPWPERIEQLTEPEPIAAAVRAAARLGVRPQLIRRTGRRRSVGRSMGRSARPVQVFAGRSFGGQVWFESRLLDDPAGLAGLDLSALAAGDRPGFGEPVADPFFLVCTHGRRNVCCARTGAPLARRLASAYGDMVWETTHVGGDRFAANLVCFPHGLYYGQLDTAEAMAAVEAYLRGETILHRLRGRAGLPEVAQAAEHFARAHTGTLAVDAADVESVTGSGPYQAVVRVGSDRYRVALSDDEGGGACGAGCEENRNTYRVEGVSLLNPVTLV